MEESNESSNFYCKERCLPLKKYLSRVQNENLSLQYLYDDSPRIMTERIIKSYHKMIQSPPLLRSRVLENKRDRERNSKKNHRQRTTMRKEERRQT